MFGEKAVLTLNNSRMKTERRIPNLLPNLKRGIVDFNTFLN